MRLHRHPGRPPPVNPSALRPRLSPALRTLPALLLVAAAPAACGSATQPSLDAPGAGAAGQCPVPVCRYEGTAWAEDLVGDELTIRGEARVVWTFSHMSGREAVYVASGRVEAAWRTDRCAIDLAPAASDFSPRSPDARHTRLRVDFTTLPVRYSATGSSGWTGTQTWRCPNGSTWTQDEGVTATWLAVEQATSPDRGTLAGTFEEGTRRSGWAFRNAP